MALPLPSSLTPSKVSAFRDCALAFRFSAIDHLPEPSSPYAVKGTLVHLALEFLMRDVPAGSRTPGVAIEMLKRAHDEIRSIDEYAGLGLTEEDEAEFLADSEVLLRNYFELEDPNKVNVVSTEQMLEMEIGSLKLRGIIDRLERDENGDLVVSDYKTGKAPTEKYERGKLGGVQFYAHLCEQVLGERPKKVRLLHLREPMEIIAETSDQGIKGLNQRTTAIWTAIERACEREDFRPSPGPLCNWCSFQEFCPAQGGDLDKAVQLAARIRAEAEAQAADVEVELAREASEEEVAQSALPI